MQNRFLLPLISTIGLVACLAAAPSHAASITYVGADIDQTLGAWRTTTVAKLLDADGNNYYGTAGYIMEYGGVSQEQMSYPGFVGNLQRSGILTSFSDSFPNTQLDIAPAYGPGPLSTETVSLSVNGPGYPLFTFTLLQPATFRLGILTDTTGYSSHTPAVITVSGPGAVASSTNVATADLVADWYFFDITGSAYDVFNVVGQGASELGATGLTFDVAGDIPVPEPGSLVLMLGGASMLLAMRRRNSRPD